MSAVSEYSPKCADPAHIIEPIYFCELHGPMYKLTDLIEKADEFSGKA